MKVLHLGLYIKFREGRTQCQPGI